ncbi:MAG: peptidase G2 autoproteolytic cleavage domain-containing protein, partial [Patescibacteria group bacterium]
LRTYNKTSLAEVELNRLLYGVYVNADKQSYSGLMSIVKGVNSNAAYLSNTDLQGTGLYITSQNVGGIISGNETGLFVKSSKLGIKTSSDTQGISSLLTKSGETISETKLNFFNAGSKPVGLGAYNYNTGGASTNSSAELGLEKIGIRAAGDLYAGYFSGNVYINGTLNVKSGCAGCADLAEAISMESKVEAGDIVAMNQNLKLRKARRGDQDIVGVVSTTPAMTLNNSTEINGAPLALAGIVPVKVTNENGQIRAGDFITASSTVGYGMKAIEPGTVVGKALQDLKNERGTIKIIVSLSWYGGQ